ncbi:MAG: 50S ribosomal protein L10 [Candidatus Berkelbacteria bacterium]|nr:50S ribosomal protein L10 [Candidatus Berkelbacteria bacterium]
MAKTRELKSELIDSMNSKFDRAKSAVIVDYKGLKVKESEELRRLLRAKNVEFNVTKNTLVRIAMKKHGIEFDESIFKKPVAIAFAMGDEVAPAKEIDLFAKKHEALEILGGILENKMIDAAMVKKLASLPSKDQMRAQFVGTIAAPLSGFVNVMAGNLRGLVQVLNAYKQELSNKN